MTSNPPIARRSFVIGLGAAAATLGAPRAFAAGYPDKPVKLLVPFPPGANVDVVARIFAEKLQKEMGQPFIIENRPGAGGSLGWSAAMERPADGYNLFYSVRSIMGITPHVYPKMKLDPVKDFTAVSQICTLPHVLIASPKAPFNNMAELVDYARKNPGKLDYASLGVGSHPHLAVEYWAQTLGLKINHIPYTGNPATDVMAGTVPLFLEGSGTAVPRVQSGGVKGIAVTGGARIEALPNVGTVNEYKPGLDEDGVIGSTWHGFFARRGTPAEMVAALNKQMAKIAKDADTAKRLAEFAAIGTGTSAEALNAAMARDFEFWGKIVRDLKISTT
jgi:tripartite-type tricarboxylate transporter receptor subunit TctC